MLIGKVLPMQPKSEKRGVEKALLRFPSTPPRELLTKLELEKNNAPNPNVKPATWLSLHI
jgi:hypothetical protein